MHDITERLKSLDEQLFARSEMPWAELPWLTYADKIDDTLLRHMVVAAADYGLCNPETGLDIYFPGDIQIMHQSCKLDVAIWLSWNAPYDSRKPSQHSLMKETVERYSTVAESYCDCVLKVVPVCRSIHQLRAGFNLLLYSLSYWQQVGNMPEMDKTLRLLENFWANGFILLGIGFNGHPQVLARPPL